jgi:hypothetical protein
MTVSSKPTISAGPISAGVCSRSLPMRSTADHTVDHDSPKLRAMEAGVPSMAATRSVAHSAARLVSTRRGSASSACSVQVFTSQSGSGQRQMRLRHRTRTKRCPAGASRRVTHRRSLSTALVPQPEQPTSVRVVSTSTAYSMPSSTTSSTSKPAAPNHNEVPSTTRASCFSDR